MTDKAIETAFRAFKTQAEEDATISIRAMRAAIEAYERALGRDAEIARLRAALIPFACIEPSSLFSSDGSENEEYAVFLKNRYHQTAFTGADLARARAALGEEDGK